MCNLDMCKSHSAFSQACEDAGDHRLPKPQEGNGTNFLRTYGKFDEKRFNTCAVFRSKYSRKLRAILYQTPSTLPNESEVSCCTVAGLSESVEGMKCRDTGQSSEGGDNKDNVVLS